MHEDLEIDMSKAGHWTRDLLHTRFYDWESIYVVGLVGASNYL